MYTKNDKHFPVASALLFKVDYQNKLKGQLEYHVGADSDEWSVI